MHVVGHLHVCVKLAVRGLERLSQSVTISVIILFGEKTRIAVMPSLHDVQGQVCEMDAGAARHGRKFSKLM